MENKVSRKESHRGSAKTSKSATSSKGSKDSKDSKDSESRVSWRSNDSGKDPSVRGSTRTKNTGGRHKDSPDCYERRSICYKKSTLEGGETSEEDDWNFRNQSKCGAQWDQRYQTRGPTADNSQGQSGLYQTVPHQEPRRNEDYEPIPGSSECGGFCCWLRSCCEACLCCNPTPCGMPTYLPPGVCPAAAAVPPDPYKLSEEDPYQEEECYPKECKGRQGGDRPSLARRSEDHPSLARGSEDRSSLASRSEDRQSQAQKNRYRKSVRHQDDDDGQKVTQQHDEDSQDASSQDGARPSGVRQRNASKKSDTNRSSSMSLSKKSNSQRTSGAARPSAGGGGAKQSVTTARKSSAGPKKSPSVTKKGPGASKPSAAASD